MRLSFLIKCVFVVVLVFLFDLLFPDGFSGARIGAFAGLWLLGLIMVRRDVRRRPTSWIALGFAALFTASLVDDPGPLAWVLYWCALSMAALWPKASRFDGAWQWGARLAVHAMAGVRQPFADARKVSKGRRGRRTDLRSLWSLAALPVIGGALFVALFAAANPLISQALAAIRLPSIWQIVLWALVGLCIWPSFRPHPAVMRFAGGLPDPEPTLPGTSLPSVLIALAVFNAIFAVQNGLDIAYLWSGGGLPDGMTQTEYVHRGAYPLIGTALIAGAMALAMLRPGSASAGNVWARRLVTLWVVQNLVLVASSALRTLDYIDGSMLTAWRIAALAWMGLVALGLVMICWRILRARSARWLINWNALAAGVVLTLCSFVDLGAVAAWWNVRHQAPETIDLCYLNQVGDGALLPLAELEKRRMDPVALDRVRFVRARILADLEDRQGRWTDWTPRGARRLALARTVLGSDPVGAVALPPSAWRNCDGSIHHEAIPAQP